MNKIVRHTVLMERVTQVLGFRNVSMWAFLVFWSVSLGTSIVFADSDKSIIDQQLEISAPDTKESETKKTEDAQALLKNARHSHININTADAKMLASALKGIGTKKAEAIVSWREQNGPFTSIEQLAEVKGINKKLLEKNIEKIAL